MKIINLDATTKSLEIKLSGAPASTQSDWTASYYDVTTATGVVLEGINTGTTNSTTAVTMVAAPSAGHIRTVKEITIYNADSGSVVTIVQVNDNSTIRVINRNTLTPLASVSLSDMSFYTDISGKLDTTALSDTAYGAGWDGDTTHTATKNAVYDKIETLAPITSPSFTTKIQTPTIELGDASDTTLSRVSAGVISVEGVTIPSISSTSTLTNKTFDDAIAQKQITTPSNPPSGYNKSYFKSDDKLYLLTSTGTETAVGTGGGGSIEPIRIRIPGEMVADTSIHQGVFWRNVSGNTITISNVKIKVAGAASGTGAAAAFNVYKSSGTDSNGIDTSAVALFNSAIDLGTNYIDDTNTPDTATVEDGRWISVRCTSSVGATTKAQDAEIIIIYS